MLGLGLGFGKLASYKFTVKKLVDDYIKRVTAAGGYIEGTACATEKLRELNSQRLLDNASWVLIPQGYEEDVVFTQKPVDGSGNLTFTRSSDATRTNSAGQIERVAWNLLQFSEQFDNANWSKIRTAATANSTIAPNGTLSADTLTGVDTGAKYVIQQSSIISGRSYVVSVYAKKNTNDFIQLVAAAATFGPNAYANFDLNNGVIGTVGENATATIENAGNGWYRCIVRATSAVTTTSNAINVSLITSATSPLNEINSLSTSFFTWGAQLVEGTEAKPYLMTTNRQDVPRLDYRNADGTLSSCPRLLLEPQRTNSIRNSTMVGAVAGSPGTLPTNWTTPIGLTQTIVGLGTENGLQYIDLRYSGTSTVSSLVVPFETNSTITAANAQNWTNSFYVKLIAQPSPPVSYNLYTVQRVSGAAGGQFVQTFTPTTSLVRYTQTVTTNNASITHIQPYFLASVTVGQTYDFTIRIAAPQMELGAYATTFIPTTTAAVTRTADVATKTGISSLIGQTQGTIFFDFEYIQPTSDANGRFITLWATNDSTNAIIPLLNTANQLQISCFSSGSGTPVIPAGPSTLIPFGRNKIAIAYTATSIVVYRNGALFASGNPTGVFPTSLTSLDLGSSSFTARSLSNPVNQAALFPERLSNADLQRLTTL